MTIAAQLKIKPETDNGTPVGLKHKPRKNWILPTVAVAAMILGGSWWTWRIVHPASGGTAGLITDTVKRGDLVETVTATGSIASQTGTQVNIGTQITGIIKKLDVDVGTRVKAHQIIATLDLPDIQAQLDQAKANLNAAEVKTAQDKSGVGMLRTQLSSAISQAQAGRTNAAALLNAARAASDQQRAQTPTDIQRGINGVESARAALSLTKSNFEQTEAGVALQLANAQQVVNQTQATSANSSLNAQRQASLLQQGAIATSINDQATATATVDKSLIVAAQQNLILVQQKNKADLQSGRDLITQARENLKIATAALTAARAETFLDSAKLANVSAARAALGQAAQGLVIANGNSAQNVLKQQDVVQAQAAADAARQQVIYAQSQVDKTIIRTPIAGTVLQLAVQQGDTLAAGLASPTLIVVADLNRLEVDAYVDETEISKVALHQPVSFTVDALANRTFTGRVSKIAAGSTVQVGVITYDVTIALDRQTAAFLPSMTTNVTIQTGKATNVLLVPSDAVKIGTSGTTVNVLTKKGDVFAMESRTVTTGGTDGVNTEILKGLKAGETVVLAGTLKVVAAKKSTSMFGGMRGGGHH